MRIFYDTEFHEDGHTIDLISIGMVREDGREYYAINAEANWRRIHHHPWLRENVLPHLPMTPGTSSPTAEASSHRTINTDHPDVKPHHRIAAEVHDFILATPDPRLWAWYAAFDHVALAWLYGPMAQLPEGIPSRTNDLKQEAERLGDPTLPQQQTGHHHALADARHNRAIAQCLGLHAGHPPAPSSGEIPWKKPSDRPEAK